MHLNFRCVSQDKEAMELCLFCAPLRRHAHKSVHGCVFPLVLFTVAVQVQHFWGRTAQDSVLGVVRKTRLVRPLGIERFRAMHKQVFEFLACPLSVLLTEPSVTWCNLSKPVFRTPTLTVFVSYSHKSKRAIIEISRARDVGT